MKEKEPMMDIDEVEEVDIENMSMEELREFIAAAEAEVILQFVGGVFLSFDGGCFDNFMGSAEA